MKVIKFFSVLLLLALIFFRIPSLSFSATVGSPKATPAVKPVNSFELFWPIVPGKVMGENLYSLKLFKEKLRALVILSPERKAEYYITISEKRLVEAEALYKRSDWVNAIGTLDNLVLAWQKVQSSLGKVDPNNVKTVETVFASSLDKQSLVLKDLLPQVPETQKKELQGALTQLEVARPQI